MFIFSRPHGEEETRKKGFEAGQGEASIKREKCKEKANERIEKEKRMFAILSFIFNTPLPF